MKITKIMCATLSLITTASVAQNAPVSPFGAQAPVATAELGAVTGQADLAQEIRAQNTGTVSHNSVTGNSQTGTISFDAQSFQGLNGLSVLSANTGNNVAINASLNVNVAIHQ